jgi:hypothetical protein
VGQPPEVETVKEGIFLGFIAGQCDPVEDAPRRLFSPDHPPANPQAKTADVTSELNLRAQR